MSELTRAWGDWLGSMEWDLWATLTFRDGEFSHDAASRAFSRWMVAVRKDSPGAGFFVGHEVGGLGGRLHLHALVGGLEPHVSRKALWEWWHKRYGRAQVLPYDPGRGAAAYVAKYVSKELSHYEIEPCTQPSRRVSLFSKE